MSYHIPNTTNVGSNPIYTYKGLGCSDINTRPDFFIGLLAMFLSSTLSSHDIAKKVPKVTIKKKKKQKKQKRTELFTIQ